MPSVPCPHCRTENAFPVEEAGRARSCIGCGRAIPSQLTVLPDAKPHVKSGAIGAASRHDDEPFRASFAEEMKVKGGFGQGAMLALILVMVFGMLGAIFWYLAGRGGGEEAAIVESKKPAVSLRHLAFQRDAEAYVIYFTLLDDDGNQVACRGQVRLTIKEVSKLGLEGRGQFDVKKPLYDNAFNVDASHFRWYDPGGMWMNARRLVCATRVPIAEFSRQPHPGREGELTVGFTNPTIHRQMKLSQKFFF